MSVTAIFPPRVRLTRLLAVCNMRPEADLPPASGEQMRLVDHQMQRRAVVDQQPSAKVKELRTLAHGHLLLVSMMQAGDLPMISASAAPWPSASACRRRAAEDHHG